VAVGSVHPSQTTASPIVSRTVLSDACTADCNRSSAAGGCQPDRGGESAGDYVV